MFDIVTGIFMWGMVAFAWYALMTCIRREVEQ